MSIPKFESMKQYAAEEIRALADKALIHLYPAVDPLVRILAKSELRKLNRNLQPSAIFLSGMALNYGIQQTEDNHNWVLRGKFTEGQGMTLTYKNYSGSKNIIDISRNNSNREKDSGDILEIKIDPTDNSDGRKIRLKLNADQCLDEYTTEKKEGGYKRLVMNGKFTDKGRETFFVNFDSIKLVLQGVILSVLGLSDPKKAS